MGRGERVSLTAAWGHPVISKNIANGFGFATETKNIEYLIHISEKEISHACENRYKEKISEQFAMQIKQKTFHG